MFDATRLGDIIVASGLATETEVESALQHQKRYGGRLGDSLVSLGIVTEHDLERLILAKPGAPRSISETDISAASS